MSMCESWEVIKTPSVGGGFRPLHFLIGKRCSVRLHYNAGCIYLYSVCEHIEVDEWEVESVGEGGKGGQCLYH